MQGIINLYDFTCKVGGASGNLDFCFIGVRSRTIHPKFIFLSHKHFFQIKKKRCKRLDFVRPKSSHKGI